MHALGLCTYSCLAPYHCCKTETVDEASGMRPRQTNKNTTAAAYLCVLVYVLPPSQAIMARDDHGHCLSGLCPRTSAWSYASSQKRYMFKQRRSLVSHSIFIRRALTSAVKSSLKSRARWLLDYRIYCICVFVLSILSVLMNLIVILHSKRLRFTELSLFFLSSINEICSHLLFFHTCLFMQKDETISRLSKPALGHPFSRLHRLRQTDLR
jgi:hypothetical protein